MTPGPARGSRLRILSGIQSSGALHLGNGGSANVAHITCARTKWHAADGLGAREGQYIADQANHSLGSLNNGLHISAVLAHQRFGLQKSFRGHQRRRQRAAKIVAQHSDELIAHVVSMFDVASNEVSSSTIDARAQRNVRT